jgi:hypothetical protein
VKGRREQEFEGRKFFAEAPLSVLIERRGVLSGIIGIEQAGRTLRVVQLQGFRRAQFHDIEPGEYLLSIAETIAHTLSLRRIAVLAAEYNDYYDVEESRRSLAERLAQQERMRRMYNQSAQKRGYIRKRNRPRWWVKELNGEGA